VTTNFGASGRAATGAGAQSNIGGGAPEPPKEEKTFFQKYVRGIFWRKSL